ncbi:MAG: IS4 family transposase [Anaerostipes hadrus]
MYDLEEHAYTDAIIQAAKSQNEHGALNEMVDRSEIPKALVIADRGYESYNDMAHIQEKGWFFLIRIKDGRNGIKMGLELPRRNEFDLDVSLKLTRKQTNDVKKLLKDKNHYRYIASSATFDFLPSHSKKSEQTRFYEINFRIVRFEITPGNYETILTSLDVNKYPPKELKRLYALRWGIETSFRDLKYTVGMLNFHSKKVMCIHQEIYAHLIMYNFSEMITSHVAISKKKRLYTYNANFSVAVHVCRLFFYEKATSPGLEAIISKNLIPHQTRQNIIHGNGQKRDFVAAYIE